VPINVRIEGSPESIRAAARCLTSKLQPALYDCASQVYKCRTNAEAGWQGEASSGFQGKMTAGGQGADTIADDALRLGQSFHQYADGLYTAQAGMQRARHIAVQGGLQVTDTEILDPVPEQQDYQRKVAVFNQAVEEADRANGILDGVQKTAEDYWKDLSGKRYIHVHQWCCRRSDRTAQEHLEEGICPFARRGEGGRVPLSVIVRG
jgi:uncharacterized protein YukE